MNEGENVVRWDHRHRAADGGILDKQATDTNISLSGSIPGSVVGHSQAERTDRASDIGPEQKGKPGRGFGGRLSGV